MIVQTYVLLILIAIGLNASIFYFSRWSLRILREKCTHRYVKSVKCEVDEDSNPKTNHYENTCKICGKKWLHTPIQEKRKSKRKSSTGKQGNKNSKSSKQDNKK